MRNRPAVMEFEETNDEEYSNEDYNGAVGDKGDETNNAAGVTEDAVNGVMCDDGDEGDDTECHDVECDNIKALGMIKKYKLHRVPLLGIRKYGMKLAGVDFSKKRRDRVLVRNRNKGELNLLASIMRVSLMWLTLFVMRSKEVLVGARTP